MPEVLLASALVRSLPWLSPRARAAIDFLIAKGYSDDYGARPLRRAIERHIEDPLSELLLRGGIVTDRAIQVHVAPDGERLTFDQTEPVREPVEAAAGPKT